MCVGCKLHHDHTCGLRVSEFLADVAGRSSSAAFAPSPFTSMDASFCLHLAMEWLTNINDCVAYSAHVSTLYVMASHKSDDQLATA